MKIKNMLFIIISIFVFLVETTTVYASDVDIYNVEYYKGNNIPNLLASVNSDSDEDSDSEDDSYLDSEETHPGEESSDDSADGDLADDR